MKEIEPVLEPLLRFESQTDDDRPKTNGIPFIGKWASWSVPIITHTEFVSRYIERLIPEAYQRYGREQVISELAQIAIPAYEVVSSDAMATFWSRTLPGKINGHGTVTKKREQR